MFRDRKQAGQLLAEKLQKYKLKNAIVLGIPRGGVIVAAEIARQLHLPLDIIVIKKIGEPGNEELALGAVGENGHVLNKELASQVPPSYLQEQIRQKQQEVRERSLRLRGKRKPCPVKGRTVIIVDDGIATGATVRMAVQMLRAQGAKKIIIAIPVGSADAVRQLSRLADEVICLEQPVIFYAIGEWYRDFAPVEEGEIKSMLAARQRQRR